MALNISESITSSTNTAEARVTGTNRVFLSLSGTFTATVNFQIKLPSGTWQNMTDNAGSALEWTAPVTATIDIPIPATYRVAVTYTSGTVEIYAQSGTPR